MARDMMVESVEARFGGAVPDQSALAIQLTNPASAYNS
jgi:hypothetical protein